MVFFVFREHSDMAQIIFLTKPKITKILCVFYFSLKYCPYNFTCNEGKMNFTIASQCNSCAPISKSYYEK
jgi:hypothetical protein